MAAQRQEYDIPSPQDFDLNPDQALLKRAERLLAQNTHWLNYTKAKERFFPVPGDASQVNEYRRAYEAQKREALARRVASISWSRTQTPDVLAIRSDIAEALKDEVAKEDKRIAADEINYDPSERAAVEFFKRPGLRALTGLTISALGAAVAIGEVNLAKGVVNDLLGLGWFASTVAGFTGMFRLAENFYSSRFGLRSRPQDLENLSLVDTEEKLASHAQHRMETGEEQPSYLEWDLIHHRRDRLFDRTGTILSDDKVDKYTPAGRLVEVLKKAHLESAETLNLFKLRAMKKANRNSLIRLAASGVASLSVLIGALELTPQPMYSESVANIKHLPVSAPDYQNREEYLDEVIGVGMFGPNFNIRNPEDKKQLDRWKMQRPGYYIAQRFELDEYINRNSSGRGESYDAIKRVVKIPSDPVRFIREAGDLDNVKPANLFAQLKYWRSRLRLFQHQL